MRAFSYRRLIALLLSILCVFGAAQCALGEGYPFQAVTTASLRLRQQPSSQAKVLLVMPAGAQVQITGESGDYYIAVYNGVMGFAAKSYLKPTGGAPAAEAYAALATGSSGEAVKGSTAFFCIGVEAYGVPWAIA